jgi:hypothetical protein
MEEISENAIKKCEQQLQLKNREISELQEAYKEKIRKSQAWEKVTNESFKCSN